MSLVFMGTPDFVVPVLDALVQGGYSVGGVYTQPDRPSGRGRIADPSPVKQYAVRMGLPVYQPDTWQAPETIGQLASLAPEFIVVAAYGSILPGEAVNIPTHSCINVHPSLLPKYRGPAPVVSALLDGMSITGVTLIVLEEKVDAGPVIAQRAVNVEEFDTTGVLTSRLFIEGARLLIETLPKWLKGEIIPQNQDDQSATTTKKLIKTDGELDWSQPQMHLLRQVKALDPWPGTYSFWRGQQVKILEVSPTDVRGDGLYGRVVMLSNVNGPRIGVIVGDGKILELHRVQLAGRRPSQLTDFIQGHPNFLDSQLPS
jgi:methionyl-tRNA formyltransferase